MAELLVMVVDCADSRAQARFWAEVLGRELVDHGNSEYEVRRASGGQTPLYFMTVPEPKSLKNRLHVDITTDIGLDAEVSRLEAAGAVLVERREAPESVGYPTHWVVMQDPEGNEFCVLDADDTGM